MKFFSNERSEVKERGPKKVLRPTLPNWPTPGRVKAPLVDPLVASGPTGVKKKSPLEVLVTLVETYEGRRWPLKSRRRFDPVDVLHFAIDELGHSQAELAKILGSLSRASEILSRRRPLTLEMIQKINARWKIPADLLVQSYRIARSA